MSSREAHSSRRNESPAKTQSISIGRQTTCPLSMKPCESQPALATQDLAEPSKAPVSVIVPVKNEAENLRRCLPALAWADEVFVVDSQSTRRDRRGRRRARRRGRPVPLQRHLPQEEELGTRQPAVPQRVGPDRRCRRGRRPRAGRGDRPADRRRRGRRAST